ncbi:hypothetical protein OS493_019872 [Desmophyllum pertusum]|uniref:Uncharacterized protein n=1 Tax=Desmophyllum pertusum TaxID=174260 RepID=A0A9W9YN80_9CNID|nr:hypothetical protein OS493_019872 [Desmophyllum pertusum]
MPSSRLRNKVYRYAVFFFPDGKTFGTAQTSTICKGFKGKIKEGETVELNWEESRVVGKIIFLHDEPQECWAEEREAIRRLAIQGHPVDHQTQLEDQLEDNETQLEDNETQMEDNETHLEDNGTHLEDNETLLKDQPTPLHTMLKDQETPQSGQPTPVEESANEDHSNHQLI